MKISEVLGRLKSMEMNASVVSYGGTSMNVKALSLAQEIIDRAATDVLIQPTEQRRVVLEEKVASTPRPDDPLPADLIGGHVEFASTPRDGLANDFADGTFPHGMGEVRRRARTEFEVAAINLIEYCYPRGEWRGDRGTMRNLIWYVAKLRAALPTIELPPSGARVPREVWIPTNDVLPSPPVYMAYAFKTHQTASVVKRGRPILFREVL